MPLLNRLAEYLQQARRVNTKHGLSPIRQLFEIVRLTRSPGQIGPGDYYSYRLFDPMLSHIDKEQFVGWKVEPRLDALNDRSWHCLGLDKVLMYTLFQHAGIRVPQTQAIYLSGRTRPLAGSIALNSPAALHAWLRNPDNYPFFSKPSASGFGRGAFLADAYDAMNDCILLREGTRIQVIEFEKQFHDIERLGYLFQTPIQADSRLVDSIGKTVSSLRMIVLCDEHEGPVLHRCFWKLPTGNNSHDNYNGGKTGNLAAAIDHDTGRVTRVINGTGLDLVEIERHPDTGVNFATLAVPNWQKVCQFTFDAALTLPKLRFQQWDIALSNDGPLALEVNLFGTGGCDLTQLLYRKGLLDDTMRAFLARHSISIN
ncbi:hypothetical protein LZ012_10560 [Dechloromonas sp. XY25]|uniref:Alpha-L-glutamate ligase-related protein ATP-grasp domain-containing protein n=1 Tax=Dechloromonas hankyongensis TaxID=2908002 RepID=A0ABS9K2Y6_9RHOO|nr:sugar-transfer associated ATP-grasp domain-containing protein [Dechloromonas hankyongensis]MCG2577434.1 hypothetical protein [Dechloromonas hankyongensis]